MASLELLLKVVLNFHRDYETLIRNLENLHFDIESQEFVEFLEKYEERLQYRRSTLPSSEPSSSSSSSSKVAASRTSKGSKSRTTFLLSSFNPKEYSLSVGSPLPTMKRLQLSQTSIKEKLKKDKELTRFLGIALLFSEELSLIQHFLFMLFSQYGRVFDERREIQPIVKEFLNRLIGSFAEDPSSSSSSSSSSSFAVRDANDIPLSITFARPVSNNGESKVKEFEFIGFTDLIIKREGLEVEDLRENMKLVEKSGKSVLFEISFAMLR